MQKVQCTSVFAKMEERAACRPLEKMEAVLIGSITSTLAIIALLNWSINKKVNAEGGCPNAARRYRYTDARPSLRQAVWGGWTCNTCFSELDRRGNLLSKN
jgi:hypothetical protein